MKAETVQEVQRVADNVIKEGIDLFSAKVSETTEEVKDKLKDTENEIEQAKSDIHFERGFRKFLFWATPDIACVSDGYFNFSAVTVKIYSKILLTF